MTNYIHNLNWNQIQPKLFVGSCPILPSDVNIIASEINADTFLSLQTTQCHKSQHIDHTAIANQIRYLGKEYLWCPMLDFNPDDQQRRLPQAVKVLDIALTRGITYLFCTAGINRSPLVTLAHMVFIQGETLDDALTLIQEKRPVAYPYIDSLLGCRSDIVESNRKRIEEEAYFNYLQGEDDQTKNWYKAETQVIRDVILNLPPIGTSLVDFP